LIVVLFAHTATLLFAINFDGYHPERYLKLGSGLELSQPGTTEVLKAVALVFCTLHWQGKQAKLYPQGSN